MGWGGGIGVVAITTVTGGFAAYILATFLIWWLPISNFEGGAGSFAVILSLIGLAVGFFVGILIAAIVKTGFAAAQLYACATVAFLTVSVAILVVVFKDDGPQIDGDTLILETELRVPAGWQPDNYARYENGSGCFLQERGANESPELHPAELWQRKYAALHPLYRRGTLGDLNTRAPSVSDGRWTLSCATELQSTTSPRYIRIYAGRKADVTIRVPLPRHPDARFQAWQPWNTADFVTQAGKPAVQGYEYRFRVQRKSDYDAVNAVNPDSERLATMSPDTALVQWLPFFENQYGKAPRSYEVPTKVAEAVKAHAAELPALLRSNDPDVARRAVFATIVLHPLPADLVEPLAVRGRDVIALIRDARARSLPGDPDLVGQRKAREYFMSWSEAMEATGPAGVAAYTKALTEIAAALGGESDDGGAHEIIEEVTKKLAALTAKAQ